MVFHKSNHILIILLLPSFVIGCLDHPTNVSEIDYLGQVAPGKKATIFAAGIVSTDAMEHSAAAFSPDGTIVLWTVVPDGFSAPAYFLEMNYENQKWSPPHRVSFNDSTADDYYPSFSPDGKKLYFSSRRKLPNGYTQSGDLRIWHIDRTENGWGTPLPLDTAISKGHEFAHSVTNDGNLFFSSGFFSDDMNGKTGWSIYKSDLAKKTRAITRLPYSINSMGYEDGPYIAPDGSFLIFESDRPEGRGSTDLYIAFKTNDNRWSLPLNMGSAINSTFSERFARVSPDGRFLFFGSSRDEREGHPGFDIYWIDVSIIEDLRTRVAAKEPIQEELGTNLLTALDDGQWNEAEALLNEWLSDHPKDADAVFNYTQVSKRQGKFAEAYEFLTQNESLFTGNSNYAMEVALLNIGLGRQAIADTLLAPLLAEKSQQWNRYMHLSTSLFDMRKFDISDKYFKKAMAVSMWHYGYFKRGCSYARIGEQDRAFENLFLAVENGFNDKQHFESNAQLLRLKNTKPWQELTAKLK